MAVGTTLGLKVGIGTTLGLEAVVWDDPSADAWACTWIHARCTYLRPVTWPQFSDEYYMYSISAMLTGPCFVGP